MLKTIHLKNIALIQEADIDLGAGLNIITGETGAGKSMVIGAVNIALGSKASRSVIRQGAASALAELLFTDANSAALNMLECLGIERDGKNISIARKITPDSSTARVNGETVTLSDLKKITSLLVDVHGQHEHQSLLTPGKHMDIIDEFGKEDVADAKKRLSDELSYYKKIRKEYAGYNMDEETLTREISLIEYECDEIEAAELTSGEDTVLETEYKKMLRARETTVNICKAAELINGDSGVLALSSDALKEISEACKTDANFSNFKSSLADLEAMARDVGNELSGYISSNSFDEEKFRKTGERLNLINHLKAKYGSTIEEITAHAEAGRKKIEHLECGRKLRGKLAAELLQSKKKINTCAHELSDARKQAAAQVEPLIKKNLKDLNFLNADFKISFSTAEKISANGFDKIEFLISTNPGEELKPLASVASGGELSRIMLAIKSAAAQNDHIPTLLFDEIDTGISGLTAQRVSEKLCSLSRNHQVICITHLPQIASMADEHFLIRKEVSDGRTISGISALSDDESAAALAAMLSGAEVTESSLANARDLKASANKFKERLNGI